MEHQRDCFFLPHSLSIDVAAINGLEEPLAASLSPRRPLLSPPSLYKRDTAELLSFPPYPSSLHSLSHSPRRSSHRRRPPERRPWSLSDHPPAPRPRHARALLAGAAPPVVPSLRLDTRPSPVRRSSRG
jgi:hypothetical protein